MNKNVLYCETLETSRFKYPKSVCRNSRDNKCKTKENASIKDAHADADADVGYASQTSDNESMNSSDEESTDNDNSIESVATQRGSNNVSNENNVVLECVNENQENVCRNEKQSLKIWVSNVRGFISKSESIESIVQEKELDMLFITESHCMGMDRPRVKGFQTFFKNRTEKNGGGVAVCIRERLCKNAMIIAKGEVAELIVVKLNDYRPGLVVMCYYGAQNNDKESIELSFIELKMEIEAQINNGMNVIVCGDFNAWLGESVGDAGEMSDSGVKLKRIIDEFGLEVMNMHANRSTTYKDHKYERNERTLDMIITNNKELFKNVQVDSLPRSGQEFRFTPFSKRKVGRRVIQTFSDHSAIIAEIELDKRECRQRRPTKAIRWKYNKVDGKRRFRELSDKRANMLYSKVRQTDDVDKMVKSIERFIKNIKFSAYGKQTVTAKKARRIRDIANSKKIVSEVERIAKATKDTRDRLKVFKIKEMIDPKKDTKLPDSATKHWETGERLEDISEIVKMILEYNVKTLSKNATHEEMMEVYRERERIVSELWENLDASERVIEYNDYLRIVEKVTMADKDVYKDFINAGDKFKEVIYKIICKIFASGKVPETFRITYLTKIYKRKGDVGDLKNYRFVHGKQWLSKLVEKIIVDKITRNIRDNTPEIQIGGMPERGCRDNILVTILTMRQYERMRKPLIMTLLDISKCFDKVKLSDCVYEAMRTGCSPAVVEYIYKLSEDTIIKMRGMKRDEIFEKIKNSVGQGTDFAVVLTAYLMGMTMEKHLKQNEDYEKQVKVGGVRIPPLGFVDDFSAMMGNAADARETGGMMTKALRYISLEANADKSSVIVFGNNAEAKKVREELNTEKVKIQGKEVSVKEKDAYLGFTVSEKGVMHSIRETFKERADKSWRKALLLRAVANHPAMQKNGFVRSAATMFRAIVVPTLLYSSECWFGINKTMMKEIETKYHKILCKMLDIPVSARYSALLSELGLRKAETYIDIQKLCFVNKIIKGKSSETLKKLLFEEVTQVAMWNEKNSKLRNPQKERTSILDEITEICRKYEIPVITEHSIDNEEIKRIVKMRANIELWKDLIEGKHNIKRESMWERSRQYHRYVKLTGRAILLWRCGMLKFKGYWRDYNERRGAGTKCPHALCGEDDNFWHSTRCQFMDTKLRWWGDKEFIDYSYGKFIIELNHERKSKYGEPIL